ncbi:peptidylprolyl isomerase [Aerococcaceae bacterium DSM 111176]|nr:peptidylprolyl isomerase [Aerococcaceae bacterium DSM 111176]
MKKSLLKLSTIALTAATLLTSGASVAFAQDDAIATIGETTITQEQFYEAMKNLSGEVTLRTLILEEVLKQNVEDPDALQTAADEEVQAQIEEAGGEEAFDQLLAYQQLGTIEEYTYQVFVRNMFQNVVEQHIDTSDEAIQTYYDDVYQTPMEAQHILVETEEEAQDVLTRLEEGEEFDAVAQEVSLDSTAANGGLLGEFTEGQMVPEFEEAVKAGTNGEVVAEPVQSEYGFHVIKVLNNGEKQPLDEIRDEVVEQYKLSKFADSQFAYGVIGRLIEEAGLTINDEDLQGVVDDLIELGQAPAEEESASEGESAATDESAASEEEAPAEESATEEEAPAEESATEESAPAEESATEEEAESAE